MTMIDPLGTPRERSLVARVARKSEHVQDVYEAKKNLARGPLLAKYIPPDGVGVELGVHKGHLTPVLLKHLRPKHLYAVDPWYLLEPEWEWAAGDKSTVSALRRVLKRLRPALERGTATVVVDDDRVFLGGLDDGSLDWVYLDTSHQYEHTVEELDLLVRKVKVGGIIAGDDWQSDPTHRHHGVCRAVRECVATGRVELLLGEDRTHQWVTKVIGDH